MDRDAARFRTELVRGDPRTDQTAIEALRRGTRDTVISWGFVPDSQLAAVLRLRELGFKWIWLDGDRNAARDEYKRLERAISDWDRQLAKIEAHIDPRMDELRPHQITVFAADGERRPARRRRT